MIHLTLVSSGKTAKLKLFIHKNIVVSCCSVVDRVPTFQPGGSSSIPGRIRYFDLIPGAGCMSFFCVVSYAAFGGGPNTCRPQIQ